MNEHADNHRPHSERAAADSSLAQDHARDDELSLGDLVKGLWGLRALLAVCVAVPMLLATAWVLFERVRGFERSTNYVIEFRFEGRSNEQYPNGLPFSLGDIVAPAVLASVYEGEGVADYGISLRDFQSAVSIAPYTPDRRLILEKYTQDKRATVAEINEAQAALNRELSAAQRRYALIGFTTGNTDIPAAKIDRILMQIPRAWERHAIETRGVLRIDARMINPDIFKSERLDGLARLNGLRYVRNALDGLSEAVDRVGDLPGGSVVRDPETGYDVSALRWLIERASLLLMEVPAGWSNTIPDDGQIETQGLPISLYPSSLFDETTLKGQDYLIAIDMLRQRMRLIRDNVSRILAISYGDAVRDPVSGLSARDIDRQLFDLEEFTIKLLSAPVLQLGLSNNPEMVRLYYDSRMRELRREHEALAGKARIVEQAIQNYQGLVGRPVPGGPADGGGFPPASSTIIPQFGDAFVDRLIDLAQRGGDTQFRQDLLRQAVNYQREAVDIEAEISRIQEFVRVFSGQGSGAAGSNAALARKFIGQLDEQLPAAMAKLHDYADITTRLAYRIRYAQDIHAIASVDGVDGLSEDFYLRDTPDQGIDGRRLVLEQLMEYATIINRLHAEISNQALGSYQSLYSAAASPFVSGQPIVSRIELFIILLAGLVGGILGLLGGFARKLLRDARQS